jgi:flavin-dependent dehydrogenase
MTDYDVIVVGAGCAGSATALLLARAGHRVLIADRARFPRDTLSTLYIQQRGVAYLARWGLLDRVAAVCPALGRTSYRIADVLLAGRSRPVDGAADAYAPRRYWLDAALAEAAVAAGAEFRDGCAVADLVRSGDRVAGVRFGQRGGTGPAIVARARLVVGADGMRSVVAAKAGATTLIEHPAQTCAYYTYWAAGCDHMELYEATGQWVGAVPTNDGATLVQAYFPQAEFGRVRADAMTAYLDNVRTVAPGLYDRMLAGGRLDRLYGTGDQRNFFRSAAGPGWALVGDAGHHHDSITARGISDAFTQAQLLADRVGGLLDDEKVLDKALAAFARERYDVLIDGYHGTLSTARLAVPPHRVAMLREIAADPVRTEDFFTAMAGAPPRGARHDTAESISRAIAFARQRRQGAERASVPA